MGPNDPGNQLWPSPGRHPATSNKGQVLYEGKDLLEMAPDERAREGVFMAFQYPIEVPGVSNAQFLRLAYNEKRKHLGEEELDPLEFKDLLKERAKVVEMDASFMTRSVNEGFSGGEKKRNEILQMAVLEPKLAILDETDSGLDIDALRVVAGGVEPSAQLRGMQLFWSLTSTFAHLHRAALCTCASRGRIAREGGKELALELERRVTTGLHRQLREGGAAAARIVKEVDYRNGLSNRKRRNQYHAAFRQLQQRTAASNTAWFGRFAREREGSVEQWALFIKEEEWKYTNIAPISKLTLSRLWHLSSLMP